MDAYKEAVPDYNVIARVFYALIKWLMVKANKKVLIPQY